MSAEALRELVGRLGVQANALSALGLALATRTGGGQLPAEVQARLGVALGALGVAEGLEALGPAEVGPLLGEIRVALSHALARLDGDGPGWAPAQPRLLQAAGDVSAGFPTVLQRLMPQLDGLGARLAGAEGRFLDVGVGVAALALEMTRRWPALQVVGIDVWAPSLAIAHHAVATAGLQARIELREQAVEALADEQAFDLAWLPSVFIPAAAVRAGVVRVLRALRPGGWILFATASGGSDPLAAALSHLRTVEWGGLPWTAGEAQALLSGAGFTQVRTLPGPPHSVVALVAGRAP